MFSSPAWHSQMQVYITYLISHTATITSQSCETLLNTQVFWDLVSIQTAESVSILDLGGFRQTIEPYYLQQLCVEYIIT